MATVTKKKTTSTTKKGGLDIPGALQKKYGPLPAWAWLAIVGVGVFLWRRHQGATTQGSGLVTATPDTGSDTSALGSGGTTPGGGGGGGDSPGTTTPLDDSTAPPWYHGGGGGGTVPASTANGNGTGSSPASGAGAASKQQQAAALKVAQHPVAASNPNFAAAAQAKTAAGKAAGVPVAFGGVTNTKTLKNGATLTTYASGRQVEQVKGKSAYVVKK